MPPVNDTFFHVTVIACFGTKPSAPLIPSRTSHLRRSRISTPSWSFLVRKSRSILKKFPDELFKSIFERSSGDFSSFYSKNFPMNYSKKYLDQIVDINFILKLCTLYIYIYILYGLIYSFFFIPPKVYTWLPPISVRRPYFPYTTFAEKYPYETGVILLRPTFDREHERVRVTFWGVGELQVTVYRYLERSDFIFTIIDYDYRSFFFRDKHEFDKFDLVE